jgi:tetratricopeptide (TPR) repeat protein
MLRDSDARRAVAIYDHVLQHLAEISNSSSRSEVTALAGSSYALRHLGRSAEARRRLDQAFARLRYLKAYPSRKVKPGDVVNKGLRALAADEADHGSVTGAIKVYEELLGLILASDPKPETELTDALDVSRVYAGLEALYSRAGESDQAVALRERRRQLWLHWDARLPRNRFVRRQLLGTVKATPAQAVD